MVEAGTGEHRVSAPVCGTLELPVLSLESNSVAAFGDRGRGQNLAVGGWGSSSLGGSGSRGSCSRSYHLLLPPILSLNALYRSTQICASD